VKACYLKDRVSVYLDARL